MQSSVIYILVKESFHAFKLVSDPLPPLVLNSLDIIHYNACTYVFYTIILIYNGTLVHSRLSLQKTCKYFLVYLMLLLFTWTEKDALQKKIISYHIVSYHIISYHIISYHIISYHIISSYIILYHIIYIYIYNLFYWLSKMYHTLTN